MFRCCSKRRQWVKYVSLLLQAFDPGKVLYIYESPAGIGICVMKVIVSYLYKRAFKIFFDFYGARRKAETHSLRICTWKNP